MKILFATDGSPCSQEALREIADRSWPEATEVKILSVANPIPYVPDPTMVGAGAYAESLDRERKRADQDVGKAAEAFAQKAPRLRVSTQVLEGSPKKRIVEEAERWGADLVVLGCHGYGPVKRFLLGSVSQAVAVHAPCSVEIVRPRTHPAPVSD